MEPVDPLDAEAVEADVDPLEDVELVWPCPLLELLADGVDAEVVDPVEELVVEFAVEEDDVAEGGVVLELEVVDELDALLPCEAPADDGLLVLEVAEVEFVDVEPEVDDVEPELLDPEVLDVVVVEPLDDAAPFEPLFEFELEFPELPVGG